MRTFDARDYQRVLQSQNQKATEVIEKQSQIASFQSQSVNLNSHPYYISYAENIENVLIALYTSQNILQSLTALEQASDQWRRYLQSANNITPEFSEMLNSKFVKQQLFIRSWIDGQTRDFALFWSLELPDTTTSTVSVLETHLAKINTLSPKCIIQHVEISEVDKAQEEYLKMHISREDLTSKITNLVNVFPKQEPCEQFKTVHNNTSCSTGWMCVLQDHITNALNLHRVNARITQLSEVLTFEERRLYLLLANTQFQIVTEQTSMELTQSAQNLETLRREFNNLHLTNLGNTFAQSHVMWHNIIRGLFTTEYAKLVATETKNQQETRISALLNIVTKYVNMEQKIQTKHVGCTDSTLDFLQHVQQCIHSNGCNDILNIEMLKIPERKCAFVESTQNQEVLYSELAKLQANAKTLATRYASFCKSQTNPLLFQSCLLQFLKIVNTQLDLDMVQKDLQTIPQTTFLEEATQTLGAIEHSYTTEIFQLANVSKQAKQLLQYAILQEEMAQQDFNQSRNSLALENIALLHLSYASNIVDILQTLIALQPLRNLEMTSTKIRTLQDNVTKTLQNLREVVDTSYKLHDFLLKRILVTHVMLQAELLRNITILLKSSDLVAIALKSTHTLSSSTTTTTTTTGATTTTATTGATTTTTTAITTTTTAGATTTTTATTATTAGATTITTTTVTLTKTMQQIFDGYEPNPLCFATFIPLARHSSKTQELRKSCHDQKCVDFAQGSPCENLLEAYNTETKNASDPVAKQHMLNAQLTNILRIQTDITQTETKLKEMQQQPERVLLQNDIVEITELLEKTRLLQLSLTQAETEYQATFSSLQKLLFLPIEDTSLHLENEQCARETVFPMTLQHIFQQQQEYVKKCMEVCKKEDSACITSLKEAYESIHGSFGASLSTASTEFLNKQHLQILAEIHVNQELLDKNIQDQWNAQTLDELQTLQQFRKEHLLPEHMHLFEQLASKTKAYDVEALDTVMLVLPNIELQSFCDSFLDANHTYATNIEFLKQCHSSTGVKLDEYVRSRFIAQDAKTQALITQLASLDDKISAQQNELLAQSDVSVGLVSQLSKRDNTGDTKIHLYDELMTLKAQRTELENLADANVLQRDALRLETYLQMVDEQGTTTATTTTTMTSSFCSNLPIGKFREACEDRKCVDENCWDLNDIGKLYTKNKTNDQLKQVETSLIILQSKRKEYEQLRNEFLKEHKPETLSKMENVVKEYLVQYPKLSHDKNLIVENLGSDYAVVRESLEHVLSVPQFGWLDYLKQEDVCIQQTLQTGITRPVFFQCDDKNKIDNLEEEQDPKEIKLLVQSDITEKKSAFRGIADEASRVHTEIIAASSTYLQINQTLGMLQRAINAINSNQYSQVNLDVLANSIEELAILNKKLNDQKEHSELVMKKLKEYTYSYNILRYHDIRAQQEQKKLEILQQITDEALITEQNQKRRLKEAQQADIRARENTAEEAKQLLQAQEHTRQLIEAQRLEREQALASQEATNIELQRQEALRIAQIIEQQHQAKLLVDKRAQEKEQLLLQKIQNEALKAEQESKTANDNLIAQQELQAALERTKTARLQRAQTESQLAALSRPAMVAPSRAKPTQRRLFSSTPASTILLPVIIPATASTTTNECGELGVQKANKQSKAGWAQVNDALVRLCKLKQNKQTALNVLNHNQIFLDNEKEIGEYVRTGYQNYIMVQTTLADILNRFSKTEELRQENILLVLPALEESIDSKNGKSLTNFIKLLESSPKLIAFAQGFQVQQIVNGIRSFVVNAKLFIAIDLARNIYNLKYSAALAKDLFQESKRIAEDKTCSLSSVRTKLHSILTKQFLLQELAENESKCSADPQYLETLIMSHVQTDFQTQFELFVNAMNTLQKENPTQTKILNVLTDFQNRWSGTKQSNFEDVLYSGVLTKANRTTFTKNKITKLGEMIAVLVQWQRVKNVWETKFPAAQKSQCFIALNAFSKTGFASIVETCSKSKGCSINVFRKLLNIEDVIECMQKIK